MARDGEANTISNAELPDQPNMLSVRYHSGVNH